MANEFWPENDEKTMYSVEDNLEYIWERAKAKWPGIQMDEITMSAEHIQTRCLGYDVYDSDDYTNFVVMTASEDYFERIKNKGASK